MSNDMKAKENNKNKRTGMERFILGIEKAGNKIPSPVTIFFFLLVGIIILSHFTQGIVIKIPGTDQEVVTESMMTAANLRLLLKEAPANFTNFAPLKFVLVIGLGVALCEYTGLFSVAVSKLVSKVPEKLLYVILIVLAINGNIASDSAVIFIPTIAAIVYGAKGRNPILGIVTSYACIAGGYCAAFIFSSSDASLAGITESVLNILPVTANYDSNIAMNWYFILTSSIVLTPVALFVSEKIVAPIVEKNDAYKLDDDAQVERTLEELSPIQSKGLRNAGLALLGLFIIVLVLTIPANSFFRDPETGTILPKSPLMDSIIILLTFVFFLPGVVYGKTVGTIKSSKDIANFMQKGISTLSAFIVLSFVASQFIWAFGKTNLATLIAIKGTDIIKAANLAGIPLMIVFILLTSFVNLFVLSASAKWVLFAPIFVPMFALLGYTPAFTQAIFRIGNSISNCISPLDAAMVVILGIINSKYKKDAGYGTIISLTMPFALAFLAIWTLLVIAFYLFNIPVGPGAGIFL